MSVLDASAIIAWMKNEPGHVVVQQTLDAGGAVISSVNLAEVLTYLSRHGHDPIEGRRDLLHVGLRSVPYTAELALLTAQLYPETQAQGLSLGDRACLALARQNNDIALTADRIWDTLDIGIPMVLIR